MDPREYASKYSSSIVESSKLPEYVRTVKNPDGVVLACDLEPKVNFDLEGDLKELAELVRENLLDLNDIGLGEYKNYLQAYLN